MTGEPFRYPCEGCGFLVRPGEQHACGAVHLPRLPGDAGTRVLFGREYHWVETAAGLSLHRGPDPRDLLHHR